ncbi:MAG: PD40 domain-containing protein [Anaerolineae bacterium]|nr:PD40 domain-containing protein [Anaerolineae bacterium]
MPYRYLFPLLLMVLTVAYHQTTEAHAASATRPVRSETLWPEETARIAPSSQATTTVTATLEITTALTATAPLSATTALTPTVAPAIAVADLALPSLLLIDNPALGNPLAQTVTAEAVYVLGDDYRLSALDPISLTLLVQSEPLVEAEPNRQYFLAVTADRILISSPARQSAGTLVPGYTLVLKRDDFSLITRLEQGGAMAIDPGRTLFTIGPDSDPDYGDNVWAYDLADLTRPPTSVLRGGLRGAGGGSWSNLHMDALNRRLFVFSSGGSGPRTTSSVTIFNADTLELVDTIRAEQYFGHVTHLALVPQVEQLVSVVTYNGGDLPSQLRTHTLTGELLQEISGVSGTPATDPQLDWIYLLQDRGLWIFDGQDLTVRAIVPFTDGTPTAMRISADGERLYFFGNGWLATLQTAAARAVGIASLTAFPEKWSQPKYSYSPTPRIETFPLPGVGLPIFTLFSQSNQTRDELYRSDDSGQSWQLVSSLVTTESLHINAFLPSPYFADDQTLLLQVGNIAWPTFLRSVDGGQSWQPWEPPDFAFTSDRDGNREIYVMRDDTPQRVTNHPADDENPAWAPDWSHLVFQSNRTGNWDLYSIRTDCATSEAELDCDLQQLTTDPAADMLPAWSPDGRWLAFVSTRDGNPEIYITRPDGSDLRRLTDNPAGDWRPVWLPNGREIIFNSDRSGNQDLYRLSQITGTHTISLTTVVEDPAEDQNAATNSEGQLYFVSDRSGLPQIHSIYNLYDKTTKRVSLSTGLDAEAAEDHPTASRPSLGLIFTREVDGNTNLYRYEGGEYTPLTDTPGFNGHPAGGPVGWVPDRAESFWH